MYVCVYVCMYVVCVCVCLYIVCIYVCMTTFDICIYLTGVGTGGGGKGGMCPPPHFSEWGAKICLCPPPHFQTQNLGMCPPTFCHVPTPLYLYYIECPNPVVILVVYPSNNRVNPRINHRGSCNHLTKESMMGEQTICTFNISL